MNIEIDVRKNFETATDCEAFKIALNILEERLNLAKAQKRGYAWAPLEIDYWLPEKSDFNYELACPNFAVFVNSPQNGASLTVDVMGVFDFYQGYQDVLVPFMKVFQTKGEPNLEELSDIARIVSYFRFYLRDKYRDLDSQWWDDFCLANAVSNDTVLIWAEDKEAAQEWANRTFPTNTQNAWIGKCGEFVFAGWAVERQLRVSRVDLKDHSEGTDEYDFSHTMLFGGKIKIDIKAFQLINGKKRNWWNVSENCLQGNHKQDLIVFAVIDEDYRMGKIVGFLTSEKVKTKGRYITSCNDFNPYANGYYKIFLEDMENPHYLRAWLDVRNQIFNGLGFAGITTQEVMTQMIKDYPLDPMIIYYSDNGNWLTSERGGMTNLVMKSTLKMFIPAN